MIIALLLLIICGISIAGIWLIYDRSESDESFKKMIAIFLAVIVALSTLFLVYDSQTRGIAFGGDDPVWGYSPYNENWGGTGPEDDFDFDGIKNAWDQDADNDEVWDSYEYLTRFNPYVPDLGIRRVGFMWTTDTDLRIHVEGVTRLYDTECTIILYKDSVELERKTFKDEVDFFLEVNQQVIYMLDLKLVDLDGVEALYSNKANNFISFTFPGPILMTFGQWYFDISNEIEGVIRNLRLFGIPNPQLNEIESLIRAFFAAIPLFGWIALFVAIGLIVWIRYRRKKRGKPPLLRRWFGKKEKYAKGTTKIQLY